jgi:hypothetical protein
VSTPAATIFPAIGRASGEDERSTFSDRALAALGGGIVRSTVGCAEPREATAAKQYAHLRRSLLVCFPRARVPDDRD